MDTRNFVADKLRKLIANYLEIDVNRVVDEAHLGDDLGVDWFDQIDLLIMHEDEFEGVQFSDGAALELVGDLIRYVEMTSRASNHPGLISAYRRSAA